MSVNYGYMRNVIAIETALELLPVVGYFSIQVDGYEIYPSLIAPVKLDGPPRLALGVVALTMIEDYVGGLTGINLSVGHVDPGYQRPVV